MSWNDLDRERIRKYLGYPVTAAALNLIQSKQAAISAIGGDAAIGSVQQWLMELTTIERQLNETRPFAGVATYSTAGSSTDYFFGQRMSSLREEARRYVNLVASTLELQIYDDYFSPVGAIGSGKLSR